MNPLAKPLFKVLAAIQDDPKYAELARELHDEYVAHAYQLATDKPMSVSERLAPIITQCRIMGLSEEEFEALEKEVAKRCAGLKLRRAQEQAAQIASLFDMKKLVAMSAPTKPTLTKPTLLDKLKGKI